MQDQGHGVGSRTKLVCVVLGIVRPVAGSDLLKSPPRPPCTFALPRSSPSCAGVSSISRDACKASAETLTSIMRDAFVVLQPNQHAKIGSGTGIRTRNLAVNRSRHLVRNLPPV